MHAGEGKSGAVVVKGRVRPRSRGVTLIASLRKVGSTVIRIGRSLVVLQMARYACGSRQVVIVVDVAIRALPRRNQVRPTQREPGAVVVEAGVRPRGRVVALIAALREVRSHVIGVRRPLVVLQVARDTRGARKVVIVVDVAVRAQARRHRVPAAERKPGAAVVEGCVQPRNRIVALLAGLSEIRRGVVGIGRPLVVLQVARDARSARKVVVVVDVAVGALPGWNRMTAGKWKSDRTMIEVRREPTVGAVATSAAGREFRRHVVRIDRPFEIRSVTRIALSRHRLELAAGRSFVTGIAVHSRVRSGERKAIVVLLHLLD